MRMRAPSRAHRPLAALGLITAASLAGAGAASASTPPTTDPTTTADAATTTDAATATTIAATPTTGAATPTGPIPPGPLCAALDSTAATGDATPTTMVTDATGGTAVDAPLTTDATLAVPTTAGGAATGTTGSAADLESIELLSTFATALDDTGVSATLTSGESYTILAPINSAFDKINLTLPTETTGLDATLNMHILPGDFDAQGLVDAGNVVSLSGDPVTFEVRNETLVINDGDAAALCTEVPGTDVSLILIDTVLEPGAALDTTTSSDTTATTAATTADVTATTAATTLGTTPDLGTVSSTTGG